MAGECLASMKMPDPVDSEVAARVRRLRETLGYETCGEFAAALGVEYNRLNNVENGHPLGKNLAFKLVQGVDGLTTDWLWFGASDGLSLKLARELGEIGTKAG